MFRVPTLLLLVSLLTVPFSITSPLSPSDIADRTKRSVVKVTAGQDEGMMICTGFVTNIARGEVITASHCVKPKGPLVIDEKPAELIRVNDAMALIKIEPFGKPALTISNEDVLVTQVVATIGWAYGEILVYVPRAIIAKDKGDFAMNGPIVPGMSGGPVVDENGVVVGINQASTDAFGIACGPKEIREFLKEK